MEDSFLRRYQKLIWFVIAVPILAMFSITGSVLSTCERPIKGSVASFRLQTGKTVEIGAGEFQDLAQNLRMLDMVNPYFLISLGISKEGDSNDQVFHFAMLYHAAKEAGFVMPQSEVHEAILKLFPSKDVYEAFLARGDRRFSPTTVEGYLRRGLTVSAYKNMLGSALAVPDGEAIVKSWQENNEEFQLEYAAFPAAELRKGIDASAVTPEELQSYFDGLPDAEKNRLYFREAKASFEGLTLPLAQADETKFAALLEGETFEENDFRQYFNANKIFRFKRPPEEKKEEPKSEEGEPAPSKPWTPFFEFDEVKDRVTKEVRLKRALEKLLVKAGEERAKEGFSWAALGKPYGLEPFSVTETKTRSEIQQLPRFGTVMAADQILSLNEGELCSVAGLAPDDFYIYSVTKKAPAGVPPLDEIREKVLENYLDKKAMDLAREKAKAFHALCQPVKPEATESKPDEIVHPPMQDLFAEALASQGLKSETIDFFSQTSFQKPEHWKEPESASKYLKAYQPIFQKKAGEISEPIEDTGNRAVYVVRVVERRLPDAAAITPRDFESEKSMWPYRSRMKAGGDSFSFEKLKKAFQLTEQNRDAS